MSKKNSLGLNVERLKLKMNPVFILVNPQMAENIGAAARAMLNFGFLNLRLVCPRENHLSDRALAMAAGAGRVLDQAQLFDSVTDACKDLNEVLATSARERYKYKDVIDPIMACDTIFHSCASGLRVGILFGGERAGLSNEDLFLAKKLIRIPSNPSFSSLNLAQSVLLISYQLNVCFLGKDKEYSQTDAPITKANYEEMQAFATRLERELDRKKFFYPEGKKKRMKTRLRKLIYGLELNKEDVKIFHGVLKSLIKNN
jgi:tRNA/rRNA methyltransferase